MDTQPEQATKRPTTGVGFWPLSTFWRRMVYIYVTLFLLAGALPATFFVGQGIYVRYFEAWALWPRESDFRPSTFLCLPEAERAPNYSPRPKSCETPRTFVITCARSDDPGHSARRRPLTDLERRNLELACDLTPGWFDSDPMLELAPDFATAELVMHIIYDPSGATFASFRLDARDTQSGETTAVVMSVLSEGRHFATAGSLASNAVRTLNLRGFLP